MGGMPRRQATEERSEQGTHKAAGYKKSQALEESVQVCYK